MLVSDLQGILDLEDVIAGYGRKQILRGVTMNVQASEIVAVIGHNGAGKSTLLKTIIGLQPMWSGRLRIDGRDWMQAQPHDHLRNGCVFVPQGNRVFGNLTVQENLELGAVVLPDRAHRGEAVRRAITKFPAIGVLARRKACTLSGGQKQLLALARAWTLSPRILLLDEPCLGLAPGAVESALDRVKQLRQEAGVTIVIVEQKVREVLRVADRVYVLRAGRVSYSGLAASLDDDAALRKVYL